MYLYQVQNICREKMKYLVNPEGSSYSLCDIFEFCITNTCVNDCPQQNNCVKCGTQCASKHNCIDWCATLQYCDPGHQGYSPASI